MILCASSVRSASGGMSSATSSLIQSSSSEVLGFFFSLRVRLGGRQQVFHRLAAFEQMQLRDLERFFRKVDSRHRCAQPRHRFREDAAAAADVEHALAGQLRQPVDPGEAQRVEIVQRAELALRIPPAVRELAEFRELGRVCVLVRGRHKQKAPPERGFS